ncbi:hypothetical protein RJ639_033669 [Escallonia herrerae]|uniref:Uncharacterized protein n=1 Tax=Escallonia herrerae TaxID=1293975 RepID=A0AA88WUI2_9ASTE|nr:hypothetical protein RJ639_033669 [Escallonia herrerae]
MENSVMNTKEVEKVKNENVERCPTKEDEEEVEKGETFEGFPSILLEKFSTMFLESDLKRLSTEKSDLLISYVLVPSLFADDFRSDPFDIARDLRMSYIAFLPENYKQLGCKFVGDGYIQRYDKTLADIVATLPVPLQFPRMRQK